jgi:hypothetical protein
LETLEPNDLPLVIFRNAVNRGFAAACNQGATGSKSDYLLFLNPDTVLNSNSISEPVKFMEDPTNQSIGIVGIQLVGEHGFPNRQCCRFPTPWMFFCQMVGLSHISPGRFPIHVMTEWPHDTSLEVDHVMGAFYLIRRRAFDALNGFDERFFVYKEDLDLSLRAKQTGWRTYYITEARAYHRGGGTSEQIKATRLFYAMRSRIQYSYKHFSRSSATVLLISTLFLEPFARLGWAIRRGSAREMFETLWATCHLFVWVGLSPLRSMVSSGGRR